jgi:hypothetical protein
MTEHVTPPTALRLRGRTGPIAAQLITPAKGRRRRVVVAIGLDGHDARVLAESTGRVVVALIDDRSPGAFEDAWRTVCWAAEHASELGARPGGTTVVAGRDASGALRQLAQRAAAEGWPPLTLIPTTAERRSA